jgi:hypothetical protein
MRSLVLCVILATACGKVEKQQQETGCTTSAECTDPAAPFCVNKVCQAACDTAADCTDPDHPICASDGACVACETAADCTSADSPVCDTQSHECRGCSADSECAGGVCIEATGNCVADADVAFVADLGNDTGTCTRAAPCATLPFAIASLGTRGVVHVLGATLSGNGTTLALGGTASPAGLVLDGEHTTLSGNPNASGISITAPAMIVVEGFNLTSPTAMNTFAIVVSGFNANATLFDISIAGSGTTSIRATNSSDVKLVASHIGSLTSGSGNEVDCDNSTLLVDHCKFESSFVTNNPGSCTMTVRYTRFESNNDRSVAATTGSHLVMENNLIIHNMGFNDSILADNLGAGSIIRFNTIVNTTPLPSDGAALSCDNTVQVTSNIFAYNSGHSITGQGCATKFSIFDDVSTTSAGTGNQVTGIDTIFVDRANNDYHLSATSIAKEASEPGQETMVKDDFEGNPRPVPAGSHADSGAFEAP